MGSVDAVGRGVSDDLAAQLRERVEAAVGLRGRGQRLVVLRRAQLFFSSDLREQTERALPAALNADVARLDHHLVLLLAQHLARLHI